MTDPDDLQAMRNAVAAGLRVTTAQRDITVDNFTGLGYILEDPKTGAAAYMISGGRNGADSPAGPSIYALPQFPANPIFGIMLSSSLRAAGAYLVAEGGVITGLMLPELTAAGAEGAAGVVAGAALAAAAILMAIILIMILLVAFVQTVDEKYPRISRKFRHYTNAALGIFNTNVIIQTKEGTFGDGVYVADAVDEEQRSIGCPPNALDVATRFQIERPDKIDPTRVTGWIEITITRDNYFVIDQKINGVSQTEYIIREPLMPTIHPVKLTLTRGLYLGPNPFGFEVTDVCF